MHIPVLLEETIRLLGVKDRGKYIDATLGLGGHALEILRRGGKVLGIEVDEVQLNEAKKRIASSMQGGRLRGSKFIQGNFKDLNRIAVSNGFVPCDGVLFDLGLSSWQLEHSGRGFSFQRDEPLDMRADNNLTVTAADLLNGLSRDELEKLFQKYGEEQSSRRIAAAVVRARSLRPFGTTSDLAEVVEKVKSSRGKLHPATKVFQALRIAVNDEINNLRSALPQAFGILGKSGRLAVTSFHSLEDREVKRFFAAVAREGLGMLVTKKPVVPSPLEVKENRRARSAKLRVVEKIANYG